MIDISTLEGFFNPKVNVPVDLADRFLQHITQWLNEDYSKLQHEREPGLHASSLWKTCGRQVVLMAACGVQSAEEKLGAGNYLTFDVGHALHHWWQNNYLGPMGVIFGDWYCSKCSEVTVTGLQPKTCPKCNGDRRSVLTYQEYQVRDSEMGYVGHCDGVLQLGESRVVFEFKTASPSEFDKLTQPKMQHVVQAHAYMHGLGLENALIVYQNKGSQCDWSKRPEGWLPGKLKLQVFHVKFDRVYWQRYRERCLNHKAANELVRSLPTVKLNHALQFERVCNHQKSPLAESCPVAKQCFEL
jgi:hypothetical protein